MLSFQFLLLLNFFYLRTRLLLSLGGGYWSCSCCWWLSRLPVVHQILYRVHVTVLRVCDLLLAEAVFVLFHNNGRCETLRFRNAFALLVQFGVELQVVRLVRDAQQFRAHWCNWLDADRACHVFGVVCEGGLVELTLGATSSLASSRLTLFSDLKTQFER